MAEARETNPGGQAGTRWLSGRRLKFARTLAVLASLVAGVVAAELFLRNSSAFVSYESGGADGPLNNANGIIQMTPRGKRLVPGARVTINNHFISGRDVEVAINSHGFRGPELAAKSGGEIRILALGDSITEGDYLPIGETWVARMDDALNARREERVTVINAGMNDAGLDDEVHLLEDRGLAVEPDVVVLAFYLNDSRPPWGFPGEMGRPGWLRRNSALADTLYRMMKLHYWIKEQGQARFAWPRKAGELDWRRGRAALIELAGAAQYDWGAAWRDDSWVKIGAGLDRLVELSRQHDFAVAAVIFPVRYQVEADYLEDTPQKRFIELAAARGIPALDLLPMLRERTKDHEGEMFYDHCHPVTEVNGWIAESVAEFVNDAAQDAQAP